MSYGVAVDTAVLITECLERHFREVTAPITGLRASILRPLSEDNYAYPVLEWKEGTETNVTSVFKVEGVEDNGFPRLPMSNLMLFGVGIGWQGGGRRFKQSCLEWEVVNMAHFRDLLQAAQNVLGIQHWAQPQQPTLYLAGDPECFSNEEYIPSMYEIQLTCT